MSTFLIAELPAGGGTLALCPLPGRYSPYAQDMAVVADWRPDLVLSMTEEDEMPPDLARNLAERAAWQHLPIRDFGAPGTEVIAAWPAVSAQARAVLAQGGKVLTHCAGGCGRSGMVALRLMVELGEDPDAALHRLRQTRPCAVETEAQQVWAQAATRVF